MFAAPLVTLLLGILQQADGLHGDKVKQDNGITLSYTDLSDADADAIVATIRLAREMLNKSFTDVHLEPIVRLRVVPGARRIYWTEGNDRIFFDFPSNKFYLNAQVGDDRIIRFALPALTQLWLSHIVTSSAGLDPRILDSLVEFADYHFRSVVAPTTPPPTVPAGPGQVWCKFETVYPGFSGYVLNLLTTQKLPGHLVGDYLRRTAVDATEDVQVARLFDGIAPPEPLLAATDVEPGPTLLMTPESQLRTSRVSLFNGVSVLDTVGDPIAPSDRLADFEIIFETATSLAPGEVIAEPPTVSGQNLANLYFEFRWRVQHARDNVDFLLTLREFLARFRDRALCLGINQKFPQFPIPPGSPYWFSVPGISFVQNQSHLYVSKVAAGTPPDTAGVKAGMELLTIDGRPAPRTLDLLADVVSTFDSTPSDSRSRAYATALLLSGPDASEAALTFAAPKKEATDPGTWSVKLKRGTKPKSPPPTIVDSALRPDGVGVITIHQFPGEALKQIAAAFDELNKGGAKGVVIDLRGNEGQHDPRVKSTPIAKAVLERIMPKDLPPTAIGAEYQRTPENFLPKPLVQIILQPQPSGAAFAGPIAVLIDGWTGGDAELFAMGIQATKRGQIFGTRSAGSVTLPQEFQDFQALKRTRVIVNLPMSALVRPGGESVQGVGISPNVEVVPTQEDLAQGRDAVLERAAASLKR